MSHVSGTVLALYMISRDLPRGLPQQREGLRSRHQVRTLLFCWKRLLLYAAKTVSQPENYRAGEEVPKPQERPGDEK